MTRKVVITGTGAVTALGLTAADTIAAMQAGVSAIGPLQIRDADRLNNPIGAQVMGFDPSELFSRSELALLDRATLFAVVAAQQAVAQAGLDDGGIDRTRAGVVLGTGGGGLSTLEDSYRQVFEEQKNRIHPFTIPRLMTNAAASQLSIRHGMQGPAYTVATACASSNHALAQALGLIRSGAVDVALSGGTDATLTFGALKAWEGLRVMSPDGCRPFCATRNGMVQGEGAAVFVLEAEDHAHARGATILAELAGAAMTADASDIVMPSAEGAARAMAAALADAGAEAGQVGYVNAHGTATAANDRTEVAALRRAFGPAAEKMAISSTKSMHGHCMGGTGAVELLAVLSALDGVIPPTVGWQQPDPDCDLDIVTGSARRAEVEVALSNAFAFGGLNAVVALRRAS